MATITKNQLLSIPVFKQMQGLNLMDGKTTMKLYGNKIYVSGKEISLTKEEIEVFLDMITPEKDGGNRPLFVSNYGEGEFLSSYKVLDRLATLHFQPNFLEYRSTSCTFEPGFSFKNFLQEL